MEAYFYRLELSLVENFSYNGPVYSFGNGLLGDLISLYVLFICLVAETSNWS